MTASERLPVVGPIVVALDGIDPLRRAQAAEVLGHRLEWDAAATLRAVIAQQHGEIGREGVGARHDIGDRRLAHAPGMGMEVRQDGDP